MTVLVGVLISGSTECQVMCKYPGKNGEKKLRNPSKKMLRLNIWRLVGRSLTISSDK
jgi:hypothetical protein